MPPSPASALLCSPLLCNAARHVLHCVCDCVIFLAFFMTLSYRLVDILYLCGVPSSGSFGHLTLQLSSDVCPPEQTAWEELLLARAAALIFHLAIDQAIALAAGFEDSRQVSLSVCAVRFCGLACLIANQSHIISLSLLSDLLHPHVRVFSAAGGSGEPQRHDRSG